MKQLLQELQSNLSKSSQVRPEIRLTKVTSKASANRSWEEARMLQLLSNINARQAVKRAGQQKQLRCNSQRRGGSENLQRNRRRKHYIKFNERDRRHGTLVSISEARTSCPRVSKIASSSNRCSSRTSKFLAQFNLLRKLQRIRLLWSVGRKRQI